MKRRALFSGSAEFRLYDLYTEGGSVNENVFAYSNRTWIRDKEERSLIFYNNSYYETAGWIKASDPAIPQGDGRKRRDNLSQALALHDDGSYFTLFREQHSNLWYIRSSKAIGENGFFVALKGYETQVFIDIYEVQDDHRGRWARLHHDLQGRPVSDPHSAINDIYLGDLYHRFTKFLKAETVNQLHNLFVSGVTKEKTQSFVESLKDQAEKYFAAVTYFIGGADGKFDPWKAEDDGINHEFKAVNKEQLWDEFKGYVERLIGLAAYTGAKGETPAKRLLKELAGQLKKNQLVCAVALGYGLLAILRSIIGKGASGSLAANLAFKHWDLDRKLKEQYRLFGASDDEMWRTVEISQAVLHRTTLCQIADYAGTFDAKRFAATIIEKNYLSDDFRSLIGINCFDDVTWFNKEAFESALFYGKLFFTLEGDSAFASGETASRSKPLPWLERVERIAEITEALEKAEAGSGYQLNNLTQLLTMKETSKSKASKTKTPEPKTSKPKTSEPKISKPTAAKAKTSTPKASKPKVSKPTASKTTTSKSKVSKPETSKPKTSTPKASATKVSKPKASAPKTSVTKTSKPTASKPKASAPKTSKPKVSETKTSKPKVSKPKASTPKTSKPKTSKPKTSTPKTKPGKRKGKE